MTILDVLLGRRLASTEDKEERVSAVAGVAVFGLDGLGSAAYGPEAALTVLVPLGLAGLGFSLPILGLIVALLGIVYFSYRQTIAAYPTGAGSYTVARENLGEHAGLLAAGCTAMTGVEAVSNGIQAFREPVIDTARRCLTLIVAILAFLLLGVAFVLPFYHIVATDPGKPGYQSLLSLVTAAIWGRGFLYYLTIASILAVLSLSANTSFADFPRLCQRLAHDGFLPYAFGLRGRRLVFTHGVCVLAVVAAALLIFFNGVTDRLIPLFAVGAFGTFTLSQAGMVRHGLRGDKRSSVSAFINGLGAFATGAALLIIVVAKFSEGAWLVVIVLPCLYAVMLAIKRHSARIAREIERAPHVSLQPSEPPIAVVFVDSWDCVAQKALQTAYSLTSEVEVLHVEREDNAGELSKDWGQVARQSVCEAKLPPPKLALLKSPYRRVVSLILEHVWQLERDNPGRLIAVVVPELVDRWYISFLNNQRAAILRTLLLLKGHPRVLIITVPWYLERPTRARRAVRDRSWETLTARLDR